MEIVDELYNYRFIDKIVYSLSEKLLLIHKSMFLI